MHALVYNAKLGKVALLIDSLPGARVVGVILASFRATLAVGPIIWVVYTVRAVLIINVVTAECPLRLRIWEPPAALTQPRPWRWSAPTG